MLAVADSLKIYELDNDDNILKKKFGLKTKGMPLSLNQYGSEYYCLTSFGLIAIDVNSFKARTILESKTPFDIDHLSGSILYLAKEGEILRLDLKTGELLTEIKNEVIKRVSALYVDKDSSIWFGSLNKSRVNLIKKNKLYERNRPIQLTPQLKALIP